MAEIRSAIIPSDRVTYTDAPLIWSELAQNEQDSFSGGQYDSLTLWEAAKQGDLVTLGEQHTGVLFSFGTDGLKDYLTIDGSTVGADYFFRVTANAAHSTNSKYPTVNSAIICNPVTEHYTIYIKNRYTEIDSIYVCFGESDDYASYIIVFPYNLARYSKLSNCYFFANSETNHSLYSYISLGDYEDSIISRNIFYLGISSGGNGAMYASGTGNSSILENNIVYQNGYVCLRLDDQGTTLRNNILIRTDGGVTFTSSEGLDVADHNVSSDTSAPGTNVVHNFDHATLFPNAASGDFRPAISYVNAFGTTWGAGAVPWEREVLVDTNGGGDYSSLATAEAGEQTIGDDLALRNEKMVISCTSGGTTTADTTAVRIDSDWNTSESCDFTIQAHEDDRHVGVWDDNKYNFTIAVAWGAMLHLEADFVTVDSLMLEITATGGDAYFKTVGANDTFSSCILRAQTDGNRVLYGYGIRSNIKNCLVFDSPNKTSGIEIASYRYGSVVENNTVSGFSNGIVDDNADSVANIIRNNIVINTDTASFTGTTLTVFETNISSDATATGTNSITNVTVYDAAIDTLPVVPENCVIFKDIINNDFRLVSHKVENHKGEMVETNVAEVTSGLLLQRSEDSKKL